MDMIFPTQIIDGTPTGTDRILFDDGVSAKDCAISELPVSDATQTALNTKANSSDVYTKTESDDLLDAKQGTITLTTTGTSGPATLVGDTLNIPQYSGGGGAVDSVNGQVGVVVLDTDDISEGATNKYLSAIDKTDLTDGGDTTLHYHATDRDRANHTGTQSISTITANGNALSWNTDESTINIPLNSNVTLQTGQETLWLGRNNTGSTIPNGTVVYATGTIGASGRITVAPYIAHGSIIGMYTLGITTEAITDGADGFITHFGKVRGIDTSAYAEGVVLYASPTTAGALTTTAPSYPQIRIPLAFVITSHSSVGTLAVRVPSLDTEMVHKTGTETIAGTKTFSDSVVFSQQLQRTASGVFYMNASNATGEIRLRVNGGDRLLISSAGVVTIGASYVAPTLDNEVATKKYVDDNSGGGGGLTAYEGFIAGELTTGVIFETSLAGAKTFTKFKCNTKTLPTGSDLIIKTYKNGVEDASATIATTASATNGLYVADDTTFVSGVFAENDRLTVSITQVGSTLSGTNLTWQLI